jgi:hypothetical protein
MRRKLSFGHGQYTTIFLAEIYAIGSCTSGKVNRNYEDRNIYILSDSHAALKALDSFHINSELVWECLQS